MIRSTCSALVAVAVAACGTADSGPPTAYPDGMVVPSGSFVRGAPAYHPDTLPRERPLQVVQISRDLWVSVHEISQDLWESTVRPVGNPSRFSECGPDCPVESLNFYEALTFANLLSDRNGLSRCYELNRCTGTLSGGCTAELTAGGDDRSVPLSCEGDYVCAEAAWSDRDCDGFRLPTEAEFEYLARGGSQRPYAIEGIADPVTIAQSCRFLMVAQSEPPDGAEVANGFGLYDLSGNVREWTWDAYAEQGWTPQASRDPTNDEDLTVPRTVRGGGFRGPIETCRPVERTGVLPTTRADDLGFRLVRSIGATSAPTPTACENLGPNGLCIVADGRGTWDEAVGRCGQVGAGVLLPRDDLENNWLADIVAFDADIDLLLIGARTNDAGETTRANGDLATYSRWTALPTEGCAGVDADGFWRSIDCGTPSAFLCSSRLTLEPEAP